MYGVVHLSSSLRSTFSALGCSSLSLLWLRDYTREHTASLQPERLCEGLIATAEVMAIGDGDEIAIDY
jgi:hypothetical protein